MPVYIVTLPEETRYEETIDGIKYRPPIVDSDGHLQVDALSNALPADAATEATLALISADTDVLNDLYTALSSVAGDQLRVDVISNVLPSPPTTLASAKKTVTTAGTQVQLGTNTCKSVSVKALASNTGVIYVGKSDVSSTDGYELATGESVDIAIDNTNRIWIDSSVNGEGVKYLWVN